MHRSRIGAMFIDYPPDSFEASTAFWAGVTGHEIADQQSHPYRSLGLFDGKMLIETQQVGEGTSPRIHLDVDTDDIDAEVSRLERLGARRLESYHGGRYWQLLDPGGLVLCVIPPHTPDFEQQSKTWD